MTKKINNTNTLLIYLFLLLLSACAVTNKTFVMPVPVTYPEERKVLMAVPVLPVEIDTIE